MIIRDLRLRIEVNIEVESKDGEVRQRLEAEIGGGELKLRIELESKG